DIFSLRTSPAGNISALSSTLKVGSHPQALGVNSRLGRLYIGDIASNTVTVIDENSNHILATIPFAALPLQPILVDEPGGRIYVSTEDSDAVVEISDSPDLPLKNAPNFHQAAAIHQAILLLREAITITVILMLLTILGATLGARSRRWRVPEIPQSLPGGAS